MENFYTITEGVHHYVMATCGDETIDDIILATPKTAEMASHLVGKLNDCMSDLESEEQ